MADSPSVNSPPAVNDRPVDLLSASLGNLFGGQSGDTPAQPGAPTAESDDTSSESSSSSSAESQADVEIAKDNGDVILVLSTARLRVSSVILASASPVFKAMLGPNFSEGQDARSVQNPKDISLPDDDAAAMTRLCYLIHHQHDSQAEESPESGAKSLFALAMATDKYACTTALNITGHFLLSNFSTPAITSILTAGALLNLSAAANLFDNRRYFNYFTRCLALDTTERYSSLAKHPALAMLSPSILILAEEQRSAAWLSIFCELPLLAQQRCQRHGCATTAMDAKFPAQLLQLSSGPIPYPFAWQHSIRQLVKKVQASGDFTICLPLNCKHKDDYTYKVSREQLEAWCSKVSKIVCGLCLCNFQDVKTCPHTQKLQRWAEEELLKVGTGSEPKLKGPFSGLF